LPCEISYRSFVGRERDVADSMEPQGVFEGVEPIEKDDIGSIDAFGPTSWDLLL
jgi:hypothetical protein